MANPNLPMRTVFFFILLTFAGFCVKAQSSFTQVQQVMQLFEKGDYEGTIKVAEKALPLVKQEFGEKNPFYEGLMLFTGMSYYRLYRFQEAEPWILRNLEIVKQVEGENSASYIGSLQTLGQLYRELGKYTAAEAALKRSMEICQKLYGINDTANAKSQNNLASLYHLMGRYTEAEQLFNKSLQIIKVAKGENSLLYATSINNLGTLYMDMGNATKAKEVSQKVIIIRKTLLGDKHPDYAGALNNRAYILTSLGEYPEAERLYLEAGRVYLQSVGNKHPDYASNLNNLADLYKNTGKYKEAEALLNESMAIRRTVYGVQNVDYATSLSNLAALYQFFGQYEKAERFFQESDNILRAILPAKHPELVTSLNNLASLYGDMGEYAKAEPLYQKARDLRKEVLGENHPSYAVSLNNLGTFYMEIGQLSKAFAVFSQARDIWKSNFGENHPDYALCLNNLGAYYEAQNDYTKAAEFYSAARDIYKKLFGITNSNYALALNNLAGIFIKNGEYKKAEPLLIQVKDTWKRSLGENSPSYITSLNNLAALYRRGQFNLPQSEQLYLQALSLRKKVLGDDHPRTADVENDLALLYASRKMPLKAVPLYLHSSAVVRQNLVKTFPVLSEKEKTDLIQQQQLMTDCNNSFLYLNPGYQDSLADNNVNLALFFKSLSLSATRAILNSIRNSPDTSLRSLFRQWQDLRSLLARQTSLPVEKRSGDIAQMETDAERIEKDISKRSEGFRKQQGSLTVTMKEVQQELAADEAVVEFVSFRLYTSKATDSVIYAAYIFKKGDAHARFIPLFEEKQLQKLLDNAGHSATGVAKNFYRGAGVTSSATQRFDTELYQLIWQPVEKQLAGIKKICFAPAGKLYGIAFHALRTDSNTLLMDKYVLQQYSSTKDIISRRSTALQRPGSVILFGSPDFTMDSIALVRGKRPAVTAIGTSPEIRGGMGVWADLPGTAEEVKQIADLFKKKKIAAQQFLHADASEENLKKLGLNGPPVLHLATHGFFLPEKAANKTGDEPVNAYSLVEDPMMRNGLVLAGGNYVWSGKPPIGTVEDGIVTAYEIAQLNLSGTGLVVLSACETALGDIKGTEGVFGLQRAFRMAGAGKMILSLWQVPDKETAELMTSFYNYWLNGKNMEEAFLQARADMRKKYSPYYWAAFVLIN